MTTHQAGDDVAQKLVTAFSTCVMENAYSASAARPSPPLSEPERGVRDTLIRRLGNADISAHTQPLFLESAPTHQPHLQHMTATMPSSEIANLVARILPEVSWYQIYEAGTIDKQLAEGLRAAHIIGSRGLYNTPNLYMGLFLLAPNIVYPLHQHPADELYHVLSGSVEISHARDCTGRIFEAGETSVTPSMRVHKLQTKRSACLILYLWGGDLTSKNWWWHQNEHAEWFRVEWQRRPDSSWHMVETCPLSAAEIARAEQT